MKALLTFVHFFGILLFFLVLSAGLGEWSQVGSHIHQLVSELPLLLIFYFLIFSLQDSQTSFVKRVTIGVLPIVILYVAYDYYFISFNAVFRFSSLANLTELFGVLTALQIFILTMVILLPIGLLLYAINWQKKILLFTLISFFSLLVISVTQFPKSVVQYVQAIYPGTFYHHTLVMDNGRLMATMYFEAKRRLALQELINVDASLNDHRTIDLTKKSIQPKDIFIVVLESFNNRFDFNNLDLQTTPAGEQLSINKNNVFAHSISPVFGGQTPRAEFEVLCGVPSLAKFGTNEFDFIERQGLSCLPNILAKQGYLTIATNPYKPLYFNEARAYKNLGFNDINFLKEFSGNSKTYLSLAMPKKGYPFDGDVFEENIQYIKKQKQTNPNKPIFNYIMTLYGHTPFYLAKNQPRVFQNIDSTITRSLNLSVYTELALENYIKELEKISPESIVLVVGDHLPAMPNGFADYQKAGFLVKEEKAVYLTPRLFMDNGSVLFHDEKLHHYDFFYKIVDILQQGELCKKESCEHSKESLVELYDSMMAKAIGS